MPDATARPVSAARGSRRPLWLALAIAVVAVAADQATKAWAMATLEEGVPRPLVGDLITARLVHNSGAAFSLGAGATWVFTVLSALVVATIIWYLPRVTHLPTAAALGLLAGGALGNLVDRVVQPPSVGNGHVVDFINYHGLFVGNLADVWIVVAAVWLALAYATGRSGGTDAPSSEAEPGDPGPAGERGRG